MEAGNCVYSSFWRLASTVAGEFCFVLRITRWRFTLLLNQQESRSFCSSIASYDEGEAEETMQIEDALRVLLLDEFFVFQVFFVRITPGNLQKIAVRLEVHEAEADSHGSVHVDAGMEEKEGRNVELGSNWDMRCSNWPRRISRADQMLKTMSLGTLKLVRRNWG